MTLGGGVEPVAALAVRLQALGAEALVCAPPDCAERLAEVGVPLVSAGGPVRALVHRATPPSSDDVPRFGTALTREIRARATAVAGAIRTDGATVAATLLPDACSREKPPVPA